MDPETPAPPPEPPSAQQPDSQPPNPGPPLAPLPPTQGAYPPVHDVDPQRSLALAVAGQVSRGYRVESQSPLSATLVKGRRPNHLLHLILTLISCLLWSPVWIALAILGREQRITLTVDQYGQVLRA
jgi:hypothetical protein